MDEKEFYNELYSHRRDSYKSPSSFLKKVFSKFTYSRQDLAVSMLEKGDRILDMGCGTGGLLEKAASGYKELYGVDISESQIKLARSNLEKKCKNNDVYLSVGNINDKNDFDSDFFDTVTALAVIEHVFDPYCAVAEVYRVLRPGGTFIIDVPNIAYIKRRIILLFGGLPITSDVGDWKDSGWDGGHLHYFTQKALCRLLKEVGFKVLKVSGCGIFGKLRNFYPSLLTGDICIKCRK